MSDAFLIGIARSKSIRFVQEVGDPLRLERTEVDLTPRDWDVMDPEARDAAAKDELGDDFDWYCDHGNNLQWWVNPDDNTAALAIYRPREVVING